ncbi:MAG: hypothetical protein FRX48_06972 [Lasallia pustulata]|uniref:F-box domain-containing protein n=1 Tax=Lasallia pustulata TaxID=136370 RepID=A0A5M8PJ28_9LECA|nr:MAG: hypothetical protein FRX48_06972 [Lasallia pustulata]
MLPLDEDVLHLVLKELRYDSPDSLYAMCLGSRRLNTLSTPYLYRSVPVGDDRPFTLFDLDGDPWRIINTLSRASQRNTSSKRPLNALHSPSPERLENMKKYTREVVVKGYVDTIELLKLFRSLQHLEHMNGHGGYKHCRQW